MTLKEQIFEIDRELEIRRRCYPNWVDAGKLSRDAARYRLMALEAVVETLRSLQENDTTIPSPLEGRLPY